MSLVMRPRWGRWRIGPTRVNSMLSGSSFTAAPLEKAIEDLGDEAIAAELAAQTACS